MALRKPVMAACSLAHVSCSKFSGNFGRVFSGLMTSLRAGASAARWTHDPACMSLAPSRFAVDGSSLPVAVFLK